MWFMTYRGELVNLTHYRLIRIETFGASHAGESDGISRNGSGGHSAGHAAPATLGLLVHITATSASKEGGTLRLTDDIAREDAELIMLRIAASLGAIGYVDDDGEPDEPPAPPRPARTSKKASAAAAVAAADEDEEPPAAPPKRRGRPRKEKPAVAAAVAE